MEVHLTCTMWLVGSITHENGLIVLIRQQQFGRGIKPMIVHFHVFEVSVIDSYPTNHMEQIKTDFHCFDSSTAIVLTSASVSQMYHLYMIMCTKIQHSCN